MSNHLHSISDGELVALIVERCGERASAELFRRYQKRVYIWCFNICHDREEAVDLTQEIFIRMFRGLSGFDHRARFSTWVFQVTRNHCLAVVTARKNQWRRNLAQLEGVELADNSIVDCLHEAEIADELDRLLEAARRVMKESELEAFVLHYREGLAVKEISRTLGCKNISGARALIQNARRKFRRLTNREEKTRD